MNRDKSVLPGLSCDQTGGLFVRKRHNKQNSKHSPPLPKKSLLGLDQLARERRKLETEDIFKTPHTRTVPLTEHRERREYTFSNSTEKRSVINRDHRAVERRYRTREEDTPGSLHGVKGRDRWQEQVREREKRHPLYAASRQHRDSNRSERPSRRESSKRDTGDYTPTPDHRLRNQMLTPSRVAWDENDPVSYKTGCITFNRILIQC